MLSEDADDVANVAATRASMMSALVEAGYAAESVTKAVLLDDLVLLEHPGAFSVQLQ